MRAPPPIFSTVSRKSTISSARGAWETRPRPVLAIEHPEHAVLLGDLQEPQVVLACHRREGEALLGGDDDRAGNGGQRARVLAVAVVADQLVDLAADDRPLIRSLALADPFLEGFPVDPRAVPPLGLGGRSGRARVAQDLELDQTIDILGPEGSLKKIHTELLHTGCG